MPIFTIFDAQHTELIRFSPEDDELGDSISVGASLLCTVSLSAFPEIENSVRDVHFSIVKKENRWRLKNPGNDLKLTHGQKIIDIEVTDGMEVIFGVCRMEVDFGQQNSSYELTWEPSPGEPLIRLPLNSLTNLVGSAKYCDIMIDNPQVALEHINVILDDDRLFIEDLNSGYRTLQSGKAVSSKSSIGPGKLFFLGDLPAVIIHKDTPDSAISFIEQRINWALMNFLLVLTFLGLLGLILWTTYLNHAANPAKIENTEQRTALTQKQVLENIRLNISRGVPARALDDIVKAKALFKNRSAYKKLEQAVTLEVSAAENFEFYKIKIGDSLDENNSLAYIKNIFAADDSNDQLTLELQYWDNVDKKLKLLHHQMKTVALPVFNKYRINSYFLSNYNEQQKRIHDLRQEYENYLNLTQEWKKENWSDVIKNLHKIEAGIPANYTGKFRQHISQMLEIAEFAEKLNNLKNTFSDSDFERYDLIGMENQIKSFLNSIQSVKVFNPAQYTKFGKELTALENSTDLLAKLRSELFKWRKSPDNFKHFKHLNYLLKKPKVTSSHFKVIQTAAVSINAEINKYITDIIDKIQAKPDKHLLKRCKELEGFVVATGEFGTSMHSQKLDALKSKISIAINNKCNTMFEQYKKAEQQGNFSEMKQVLKNILETASENSKYYVWAEKKQKRPPQ